MTEKYLMTGSPGKAQGVRTHSETRYGLHKKTGEGSIEQKDTMIQEASRKLIRNKTVLIIAHRLPLVVNRDQILVLEKGKLVETGKHPELMALNGWYHQLFELQKKSMPWKAGT